MKARVILIAVIALCYGCLQGQRTAKGEYQGAREGKDDAAADRSSDIDDGKYESDSNKQVDKAPGPLQEDDGAAAPPASSPAPATKLDSSIVVKNGYKIVAPNFDVEDEAKKKITGLVLLVDFDDMKATVTAEQVFDKLNDELRQHALSKRQIDLRHIVIGPFRAKKPYSFYINKSYPEAVNTYDRAEALVQEVIAAAGAIEFDYSKLTMHQSDHAREVVQSLIILFVGDKRSEDPGWARGLWPHAGWLDEALGAAKVRHYQLNRILDNRDYAMGTIIHETGHQILGLGEQQGDWSAPGFALTGFSR
jgi:hypothetical protein